MNAELPRHAVAARASLGLDTRNLHVTLLPRTLDTLAAAATESRVIGRERVRVWPMSGVERIHLADGRSLIVKYAVPLFASEADTLLHVRKHGVPVPSVLAHTRQPDTSLVMLLEDLGDPIRTAPLGEAAAAAVAVHRCPPLPRHRTLDQTELAELPERALQRLDLLRRQGRWHAGPQIGILLASLARVAARRARGARTPPFGLCHSEFAATSLHIGPPRPAEDEPDPTRGLGTLRLLDFARAYTGPGLLDLAAWPGHRRHLDPPAVKGMIDAYIAAGGPPAAGADRGGLPAYVWAAGWDRVWIADWYLEVHSRYKPDPPSGPPQHHPGLLRFLTEASQCLT